MLADAQIQRVRYTEYNSSTVHLALGPNWGRAPRLHQLPSAAPAPSFRADETASLQGMTLVPSAGPCGSAARNLTGTRYAHRRDGHKERNMLRPHVHAITRPLSVPRDA